MATEPIIPIKSRFSGTNFQNKAEKFPLLVWQKFLVTPFLLSKISPENFDLFKHLLIKLNPTFAQNLLKKFFSFAKKFFGSLGTLNLPKNNIVWLSDLLIKTLFLKTQKSPPKKFFLHLSRKFLVLFLSKISPKNFDLFKNLLIKLNLTFPQNLLKKFLKTGKIFIFFIEINFYLWRLNL